MGKVKGRVKGEGRRERGGKEIGREGKL